jgi:spermidine synthase
MISLIYSLSLLSGLAALCYQTLGFYKYGLALGGTHTTASLVLAVFFSGLGLGSLAVGYLKSTDVSHNIKLIIINELLLLLFIALTFWVHLSFLFISCLFMGAGTPLLWRLLSSKSNAIYGFNIAGAFIGALASILYLIPEFGYSKTLIIAMIINAMALLFLIPLAMMGTKVIKTNTPPELHPNSLRLRALNQPPHLNTLLMLAGFSGFTILCLEVLWNRAFSLLHQNSVQTFGIVIGIVIGCLGITPFIIEVLTKKYKLQTLFKTSLALSIPFLFITPYSFVALTDSLQGLPQIVASTLLPTLHLNLIAFCLLFIFPLLLFCGSLFPLILKALEADPQSTSKTKSQVLFINTIAGTLGALFAGFLLPYLGLWQSFIFIGCLYAGVFIFVATPWRILTTSLWVIVSVGLVVFLPTPAVQRTNLNGQSLTTLELKQNPSSIISVVESSNLSTGVHRNLVVNNQYSLGGTRMLRQEKFQAELAFKIHPQAQHVLFLGMGTGITAGVVQEHPNLIQADITEIDPGVIEMAQKHFEPYTQGLFKNPKAHLLKTDARSFVKNKNQTYDLIIGDLFVPWKRGAGTLFHQEHFKSVHNALKNNGVFIQWLPSWQISSPVFWSIAKTFSQTFKTTTLWLGLDAPRGAIALVGTDAPQLPFISAITSDHPDAFQFMQYYAGQLYKDAELDKATVITEDNDWLAFNALIPGIDSPSRLKAPFTDDYQIRFNVLSFKTIAPEHDPQFLNLPSIAFKQISEGFFKRLAQFYFETGNSVEYAKTIQLLKIFGVPKEQPDSTQGL